MEYKWYEDEDFWETFQPILFNEDRIKNTPYEVDKIINLLNIREGSKNPYISLKKGGKFLNDMNGKETLARIFRERDWYRVGDRLVVVGTK